MQIVCVQDNARRYLEQLQEAEFDPRGISLQDRKDIAQYYTKNLPMHNKELQQRIEAFDNELFRTRGYSPKEKLLGLALPTKYENPSYYSLMKNRFESIREEAVNLKKDNSVWSFKDPVFGTLPTGQINAMAIQVPDSDDHLIVFEEQIIVFCNLLSKIIAQSIPQNNENTSPVNKSEIMIHLDENPQILARFLQLITLYVTNERISDGTQYNLDKKYDDFVSLFNHSIELFLFGHEYGHIVQWKSEKIRLVEKKLRNETISEIYHPWEEEFLSDMIGLNLMTSIMKRKHNVEPAWSLTGIQIILHAIHMLDNVDSIVNTGNEIDYSDKAQINPKVLSHPPANMRWKTLEKFVIDDAGEWILANSRGTQIILSTLWQKAMPRIKELQSGSH